MIEHPQVGDTVWVTGFRRRCRFEPAQILKVNDPGRGFWVGFNDEHRTTRDKVYTEEEALALSLLMAASQEV